MCAAIKNPNIIVFVDGYAGALSEIPALWQLRPIQYHVMRQRWTGLKFAERRKRDGRCESQYFNTHALEVIRSNV
jgi:hypothetical protein